MVLNELDIDVSYITLTATLSSCGCAQAFPIAYRIYSKNLLEVLGSGRSSLEFFLGFILQVLGGKKIKMGCWFLLSIPDSTKNGPKGRPFFIFVVQV